MHRHADQSCVPESPAETAERRKEIARRKYPRRDTKKSYDRAFATACLYSGLSLQEGSLFMSYLLDEIAERLVAGQMVRVPRLGVFGVVPIDSARKFRVHFCADAALRLRVHQELYNISEQSLMSYLRTCRAISAAVPRYEQRGSSWKKLMEFDRRRALRHPSHSVHLSDLDGFY